MHVVSIRRFVRYNSIHDAHTSRCRSCDWIACVCDTFARARVSLWGCNWANYLLLQQRHLRQCRSAARGSIHMDTLDTHVQIWSPYAERPVALGSRCPALLLHCFEAAHCSVVRHSHDHGRFEWCTSSRVYPVAHTITRAHSDDHTSCPIRLGALLSRPGSEHGSSIVVEGYSTFYRPL